jgi:hypothetical protein
LQEVLDLQEALMLPGDLERLAGLLGATIPEPALAIVLAVWVG